MSNRLAPEQAVDVLLVGAGVMSATLGSLIRQLEPSWTITTYERLDAAAAESSDPWNNAGTGHSALCELNYTPELPDGRVDISKALTVNEQFQVTRQYWAHAVENGILPDPREFITPVDHYSFVRGEDGVKYLRTRYDTLAPNPIFGGLEYSDDPQVFRRRLPLMAKGRDTSEKVAISWSSAGTDVDFGALTQLLTNYVAQSGSVHFGHEVRNINKDSNGWRVKIRNLRTRKTFTVRSRFVFVGAGGGALGLLQSSGISAIKNIGGFPLSGKFLRCDNPDVVREHNAKVYGRAALGAPPMSVPHLDTRVINGVSGLLFGPYGGWSPKFLKEGSAVDLPASVRPGNIFPMTSMAFKEFGLLKYLIQDVMQTADSRIGALSEFVPSTDPRDWSLITAGQRVQVIRGSRAVGTGELEFGTSVITNSEGSIAGLLGASPGASTAVPAMLDVLQRCFPQRMTVWEPKIREMVPSYKRTLNTDPALFEEISQWTTKVLGLRGASTNQAV